MLKKQLTIPPVEDLVTVADIKANARIESDELDLDPLIESLIPAAVQFAELRMERVLMPQTWECYMDGYQAGWVVLPVSPVRSVVSITYIDKGGSSIALTENDYELDNKGDIARIKFNNCFQARDMANAITITLLTGYENANRVPLTIKQAVIILVTHWMENSNGVAPVVLHETPASFDSLLSMHLVYRA